MGSDIGQEISLIRESIGLIRNSLDDIERRLAYLESVPERGEGVSDAEEMTFDIGPEPVAITDVVRSEPEPVFNTEPEQESEPESGPDMPEESEPEPESDTQEEAESPETPDSSAETLFDGSAQERPTHALESINDLESSHVRPSIMDSMSVNRPWKIDIPGTPVRNILSAISLNDRVLFIEKLFGSNPILFQETVSYFNSLENFSDAETYIAENFTEWDLDSDTVYRFMMAVRRKLQ